MRQRLAPCAGDAACLRPATWRRLSSTILVERAAHAQILFSVSSALAALPLVDRLRRPSSAPCFRSGRLAGDHQGRRRCSAPRCRGRHCVVAASTLRIASALCAASPPLSSASAARCTPTSSGAISISRHLAVLERGGPARGRGGDLVHAVLAVHDQRALESQLAQRLGDGPEPAPVEHADELALDQGGVRHRPQQIEDGAGWARARPAGRRRCAWRCGGAAPSGSRRWPRPAPSRASRSAGSSPMPSAASTSAAPDLEVKARLPCLATGTPAPATTRAEQDETL